MGRFVRRGGREVSRGEGIRMTGRMGSEGGEVCNAAKQKRLSLSGSSLRPGLA